jgi:agmatine/peptidylarginine deiminase
LPAIALSLVGGFIAFGELDIPLSKQKNRPIPEFAPTDKIVLPIGLFQFNYQADKLVEEIIRAGASVEIVGQQTPAEEDVSPSIAATVTIDHTNIWLRDYAPIPFKDDNRIVFLGIDSGTPDPENTVFGRKLTEQFALEFRDDLIPIEGGNFLTDGTNCFMSGILGSDEPNQTTNDQIVKVDLGCKRLVVIENPPHVHIDMYAKILSANAVAVNEINDLSLDLAKDSLGDIPLDILELKNSLDSAASQFSKYLHVVRIPMPVPFKNTFRTYTNSILVNGTAIVPDYLQYRDVGGSYPDESILPALRQKAAEIYRQFGFTVAFVNADNLIYNGGAFHCVSIHLPKNSLTVADKKKQSDEKL